MNIPLKVTCLCVVIISIIYNCNISEVKKSSQKSSLKIDRRYEKKITEEYKNLMSLYSYNHYREFTYKLENPKIIVVHTTASRTIKPIIETFKPDILAGRTDAKKGGDINLGAHFIIDRDGTIYSIIPVYIMARHTIGFNHTSIGIENVGYPNDITEKQLEANVELIKYIRMNIKTIDYVIGHHEFNKKDMPHYGLMKQYNKNYKLGNKIDPGDNFMRSLRAYLK